MWLLWVAYVGTTLLLLYTNSFAVLLFAAHNAAFLLWPGVRRRWRRWLAGQAVVALAYLPWAVWALKLLSSPLGIWTESGTIPELLSRVFESFALGGAATLPLGIGPLHLAAGGRAALALVGAVALLFAVGLVAGLRSAKARGGLVAGLFLALPLLICVALAVKSNMLRDRYMLPFLPGYLLGVAAGATALGRRWAVVGVAALVLALVPTLLALPPYYRTTVYASVAQVHELQSYVQEHARPDAVAIVNLPVSDPFFQYYRLSPPTLFISDARPGDRETGLPQLKDAVAQHGEVWLVPFGYGSESDHFVDSYLGSVGFKTEDRWFGNLQLVRYALAKDGAGPRQTMDATFVHPDGQIRLAGYRLAPAGQARPGDVLSLTLYWQPSGPTAARYKVFVHLDDSSGKTRVQQDAEPLGGKSPTTGWRAGEEIADNYGLAVPADLPPGEYKVDVGLYGMDDGTRLSLPSGDNHFVVATLKVGQ